MNRVRDNYLLTPDQQWLDHMNAKRRAEQLDVISYEAFEIILDRLEKEWFALVKRIPSRFSIGAATDEDEYPEDTYCAICDDGEGENLSLIHISEPTRRS